MARKLTRGVAGAAFGRSLWKLRNGSVLAQIGLSRTELKMACSQSGAADVTRSSQSDVAAGPQILRPSHDFRCCRRRRRRCRRRRRRRLSVTVKR